MSDESRTEGQDQNKVEWKQNGSQNDEFQNYLNVRLFDVRHSNDKHQNDLIVKLFNVNILMMKLYKFRIRMMKVKMI